MGCARVDCAEGVFGAAPNIKHQYEENQARHRSLTRGYRRISSHGSKLLLIAQLVPTRLVCRRKVERFAYFRCCQLVSLVVKQRAGRRPTQWTANPDAVEQARRISLYELLEAMEWLKWGRKLTVSRKLDNFRIGRCNRRRRRRNLRTGRRSNCRRRRICGRI